MAHLGKDTIKGRMFLKAEQLYRYFMGDEELDTLILCKPEGLTLLTTDQSLYEALGALEDRSKLDMHRLVKMLESVEVLSYRYALDRNRRILTEARVQQIRNKERKTQA